MQTNEIPTTRPRTTMRRGLTMLLAAGAATGIFAATALGVTATMGNDAVERGLADTYHNFTIVDKNNPAPFDGTFREIQFYAQQPGTVRFLIVDGANKVTWTSDEITATAPGAQTAVLPAPVSVTAGSNLGVYSKNAGVVSWTWDPAAARSDWETHQSGLPAVGETLTVEAADDWNKRRFYSMNATIKASSPDICKKGGWATYGYRNQGQCVSSVVANEHAGKR